MTTLTTTDHVTPALTAVNAQLALYSWTAYRPDEVSRMQPKPSCYVEVTCERRYMADPRLAPYSSMRLWRVTCVWVADYAENADLLEAACHAALEQQTLVVDSALTTPLQHEVTEATSQDDDSTWSGYVDFTYAI